MQNDGVTRFSGRVGISSIKGTRREILEMFVESIVIFYSILNFTGAIVAVIA